jgi:hypothetical protein
VAAVNIRLDRLPQNEVPNNRRILAEQREFIHRFLQETFVAVNLLVEVGVLEAPRCNLKSGCGNQRMIVGNLSSSADGMVWRCSN